MATYDYNDTVLVTLNSGTPTTTAVVRAFATLGDIVEAALTAERGEPTTVYLGSRWGSEMVLWTPETQASKIDRWLAAEARWLADQAKADATTD